MYDDTGLTRPREPDIRLENGQGLCRVSSENRAERDENRRGGEIYVAVELVTKGPSYVREIDIGGHARRQPEGIFRRLEDMGECVGIQEVTFKLFRECGDLQITKHVQLIQK